MPIVRADSRRSKAVGAFGPFREFNSHARFARNNGTTIAAANWRGHADAGGRGFGVGFATGALIGAGSYYGGYPYGLL